MPRRTPILLALSAAAGLAACASPRPAPEPGPIYATAQLRGMREPAEPTARTLAGAAWLQSRRSVTLGEVEYDGLTLPLISPDARHLATRTGETPAWEAVLAQGHAPVASGSVKLYSIDPHAPAPLMQTFALPDGVLLGRAANNRGALVERPSLPGSPRRIGMALWQTGQVEWLTDEAADCAFATIGADGTLAYCRRTIGAQHWELVVRLPTGKEFAVTGADSSVLFPVIAHTSRGAVVFAILAGRTPDAPFRLAAFEVVRSEERPSGALTMVAGAPLVDRGTIYTAYQCVASVPACVSQHSSGDAACILLFSPAAATLHVADLVRGSPLKVELRSMVPGTLAGAMADCGEVRGVVACTPAERIYLDLAEPALHPVLPAPAPVRPKAGIPTGLTSSEWCLAVVFIQTSTARNLLRVDLIGTSGAEDRE